MRLEWVVALTVSALLASAGVLSASLEARQIKPLFDDDGARTHQSSNLGRSLRVIKTSGKNEDAIRETDAIAAEERIPFTTNVKLGFWETLGISTTRAKKWLGMSVDVYGPALALQKEFPAYLSYYNRIEKNTMWKHADRHIAPTYYWMKMEEDLGREINTLKELNSIRNTNAFRKYKRYAHTFDESTISVMESAYRNPTDFGNDLANTKKIEWWARAEIWGKYKIESHYVKKWAENAGLHSSYYRHYEKTFDNAPPKLTLIQREKADKEALKGFMLAEGSKM